MLLSLLLACAPRPAPPPPGWTVEVVARAGDTAARAGEAAGPGYVWAASMRASAPAATPLAPGECVPAGGPASVRAGEPPRAVRLTGALRGALIAEPGGWRTAGPAAALDPAWSVSDLVLVTAGEERRLTNAVRFGPAPLLRSAERRDGAVQLRWDPRSVQDGELELDGVAGPLRCGVGRGGALLPAAAAPTPGAVARLRSVSTRMLTVDGAPLEVRAVLERVVPLDGAAVEVAPSAWPPAYEGPEPPPAWSRKPRPFRG